MARELHSAGNPVFGDEEIIRRENTALKNLLTTRPQPKQKSGFDASPKKRGRPPKVKVNPSPTDDSAA